MSKKRKKAVTLPQVGRSGNVDPRPAIVPDPYERGQKIVVMKNVLCTPLDYELARGTITEDQKEAGRHFEALHDRAEIGGAKAFDYSQPKVDTSMVHKGLAEGVAEAQDGLRDIRRALGARSFDLLYKVVGKGIHIDQLAREGSFGEVWQIRETRVYYKKALGAALQDLADHLGIVAKGSRSGRIRAYVVVSD